MDEPNPVKRLAQASSVILPTLVFGAVLPYWAAIDPERKWINAHGMVWFVALNVAAIGLLWWIDRLYSTRAAAQRECSTLREELAAARHDLEVPTERDVKLFQQFESDFPATDGVVRYLRNNFFGKQWTVETLEALDDLQETWRYGRTFDDPEVEAARVLFWERLDEFTTLLGDEGDVTDDNPKVARLIEARNRPNGQQDWEAARAQVREGASALVTAYEALIKVARKRRL